MVSRGVICLSLSVSLALIVILVTLGVLLKRKYRPFTRKTRSGDHERSDDQVASMRNYIENVSLPPVFILCVFSRHEIVSFAENADLVCASHSPPVSSTGPIPRSGESIAHFQ